MQGLKQFMQRTSFLKKAFLSLLTITVLITAVLASVLLGVYVRSTGKLINKFLNNLLMQSNYSITYTNELAQRITASLSYKKEIVAFLHSSQRDNMTTVLANRTINEYTNPLPYVDSVYLYNKKQNLVLSTKTGEQTTLEDFYDREIADLLSGAEKNSTSVMPTLAHTVTAWGRTSSICSYIVPQFSFEGEVNAALVVNISTEVLTSSLKNINSFNNIADLKANSDETVTTAKPSGARDEFYNKVTRFIITDEKGSIIGESPYENPDNREALSKELARFIGKPSTNDSEEIRFDGTDYLLVYNNENSNGWYLFGMVPKAVLYKDVTVSLIGCLVVIFLFFIFCSLVALALAKRLNRPVEIIGRLIKGEATHDEAGSALKTEEFKYMASVFKNMQEESRQFSQYKTEASRYLRQEFLENLVSGAVVYSEEKQVQRLAELGCSFIIKEQLWYGCA